MGFVIEIFGDYVSDGHKIKTLVAGAPLVSLPLRLIDQTLAVCPGHESSTRHLVD